MHILNNHESITSLMTSIFTRIGFETGRVKRIFDENLISWGYFTDHNPFEPHCNAHPNNFVILNLFDIEN